MIVESYVLEWLHLGLRWLHVVAAIAWVGSSFYFNRIDRSFRPPEPPIDRVSGQLWSIHGGALYDYSRYPDGPGFVPAELKWSKWESFGTWMSGALLLAVVYWFGAGLNLVAEGSTWISPVDAVSISILSIVAGWMIYDVTCRLIDDQRIFFVVISIFLAITSWALFQVFSGKAALLHMGIIMATMMAGNVWFLIMPTQSKMLRAIADGNLDKFKVGREARKRGHHSNYLTLPVVLAMLSAHFPFVYGNRWGWLAYLLLCAAGVLIRFYFNSLHAGTARSRFLGLAALPTLAAMALLTWAS